MSINALGAWSFTQRLQQSAAADHRSRAEAERIDFSIEIAVEEVEAAQPSVEDVKKEFAAFLDSLQITQVGTAISVSVTDAAWEKMAADPEYKQRMMDLCKRDLCDPAWGTKVPCPAVSTIRIDADCEEEYLACAYGGAVAHRADTSDSFWTRRSERNKEMLEIMEERGRERREMLAFLQKRSKQRQSLAEYGYAEPIASRYFPATAGGAASLLGSLGGGYL